MFLRDRKSSSVPRPRLAHWFARHPKVLQFSVWRFAILDPLYFARISINGIFAICFIFAFSVNLDSWVRGKDFQSLREASVVRQLLDYSPPWANLCCRIWHSPYHIFLPTRSSCIFLLKGSQGYPRILVTSFMGKSYGFYNFQREGFSVICGTFWACHSSRLLLGTA